jgi:exopolyphosphatase/guanosine-5'-triphosphate,3'-diphosphate pyrophosphatase
MGLEPARADIIVGGAAVLRVIMDLAGLEEILVSEKDILDGLVIDLYRRTNGAPPDS